MLTGLAVVAPWQSALPAAWAWLASLAVLALGGWQIRREGRRAGYPLQVHPGGGRADVAGCAVTDLRVRWVGPLACLAWRDAGGRLARCVFWPDTLTALQRRELRLAASSTNISQSRQGMAP